MTTQSRWLRLIVWSVVGVAAQGFSRLATNVIVARMSGLESLGHVGTISAAAFGVALLGPTALAATQTKFVAQVQGAGGRDAAKDLGGSLSSWCLCLSILLSILVGWWLALTVSPVDAISGFLLTAGASLYSMARSACFLNGKNAVGVRLEVGMATAGLIGAAILAWTGGSGGILLLPQAIALICYAAYFLRPSMKPMRLSKEMLEFVALSSLAGLASAGVFQMTILVARLDGGVGSAGMASAALAVSTPLSFIAGAVTSVLYPRFSRLVGAQRYTEALALSRRSALGLASVLLPPLFLVTYFAEDILSAVWGAEFAPSGGLVAPLVAGIIATAVAAPEVAMLTARSRSGVRESTVASVAGTAVGVTLWAMSLWLPGNQLPLIAYGYMLSMSLTALASTILLKRGLSPVFIWVCGAIVVVLMTPWWRDCIPEGYQTHMGIATGLTISAASLIGAKRGSLFERALPS